MKKIPTIFVRDWLGTVGPPGRFLTRAPHIDAEWVFAGVGVATRKLDGTCCLVKDGMLYKRHEVKVDKRTGVLREIPAGFDKVYEDEETGAVVGWLPVSDGPEDRWHREAWGNGAYPSVGGGRRPFVDGTYELLGPKVQGNPERFPAHVLVAHTAAEHLDAPRDYDGLRDYLDGRDIEGIVWHHPDGRMAKIKAKDFGLKR